MTRPFLTAEWRHLLMLNYAVSTDLLLPYLPPGLELDLWNGTAYVSMVGFLFLRTRIKGVAIPGHSNFEEVNLRFYVRRRTKEGWRRGVVFIREIVPRRLIATVARKVYGEPYLAIPMRHHLGFMDGTIDGRKVEYGWLWRDRWNSMTASVFGEAFLPAEDSEEAYITEHYWGYTARKNGGCMEYQVEHPRWNVWRVRNPMLNCDAAVLYGDRFIAPLSLPPKSAFIAEGSDVQVFKGRVL